MTTQSPDQSLSQSQGEEIDRIADKWAKLEIPSNKAYVPFMRDRYRAAITEAIESISKSPAPSKEMEELPPSRTTGEAIERLLTLAGISVEAGWTFMDGNVPRKLDEVRERIMELYNAPLAAELAKEREAELAIGVRINAIAFWCDNRHVVDYEEAFNIERDLLNALQEVSQSKVAGDQRNARCITQISELKRELSEAREQMDTFINQWSETNNSLQRENLALSLAYQRQKEALEEMVRPMKSEDEAEAAYLTAKHALAETPDVSMLEKVVAALKLAYARGHYCDNVPCPGCECGHVLDSILGRTVSQDECEQFVTSHFIKVSTLQPDHQK